MGEMGETNSSGENSSADINVRALGRALDGDGSGLKEGDHEEEVLMKRMISEHPLFQLLLETHINCLKVGLNEVEEVDTATSLLEEEEANNNYGTKFMNIASSSINPTSPDDLDKFMEAYCMALNKLKEAIEEPLRDATFFISNACAQLSDLGVSKNTERGDDRALGFSDNDEEPVQATYGRD